jgi:hypothetical protein
MIIKNHNESKLPQSQIKVPDFSSFLSNPKIKLFREVYNESRGDNELENFVDNLLQELWGKWHEVDISEFEIIRDSVIALKRNKTTNQEIRQNVTDTFWSGNFDYEDRYVMFVDILGFRKIIQKFRAIDIRGIFDILRSYLFSKKKGWGVYVSEEIISELEFVIMSDSVVISFPKCGDGFLNLILSCVNMQLGLLGELDELEDSILEFPILFRGGVACGEILHDKQIVFGQALIDAYKFEEKIWRIIRVLL